METKKEIHELKGSDLKNFVFAGNATFTIVNEQTGNRFTYRIRRAGYGTSTYNEKNDIFYVSVLTGSDNNSSYTFVGTYFGGNSQRYVHSQKSRISVSADSNKVISWFFSYFINNQSKYPTVKSLHSGKCGKCGKKLTTPDSIKSGLGPKCGNRD